MSLNIPKYKILLASNCSLSNSQDIASVDVIAVISDSDNLNRDVELVKNIIYHRFTQIQSLPIQYSCNNDWLYSNETSFSRIACGSFVTTLYDEIF